MTVVARTVNAVSAPLVDNTAVGNTVERLCRYRVIPGDDTGVAHRPRRSGHWDVGSWGPSGNRYEPRDQPRYPTVHNPQDLLLLLKNLILVATEAGDGQR